MQSAPPDYVLDPAGDRFAQLRQRAAQAVVLMSLLCFGAGLAIGALAPLAVRTCTTASLKADRLILLPGRSLTAAVAGPGADIASAGPRRSIFLLPEARP